MSDKNQRLAEIFVDHLNAVEASCVNARRQIGELFNVTEPQKERPAEAKGEQWNFDALPWEERKGERGPFQQTDDKANGSSELWKQLKIKLHEHNGFWQHRGSKYWFDRGRDDVIDRRRTV
jgi:hypothetical protein